MLIKHRRLAVLAALSACLCAGCQPAASPTPSPAPTYRCTPEAGGAEFNCSQPQHDEMIAKDNLYTEAEAVYRKFHAEDERVFRAGGILTPSPVLLETTTGAFLEDSMQLYKALSKTNTTVIGGEMKVVWLRRTPGVSKDGSVVSMTSCVDGRTTKIQSPGSPTENGTAGTDVLYFVRVGGALKIDDAQGEEVESC